MDEKKDPDRKVKGLPNLLSSMDHHYTMGLRAHLPYNFSIPPNPASVDEIRSRTKGLEIDLRSVREAVERILAISKEEGYEVIRQIIEDEMYKDGFEQRFRQR